MKSSDTHPERLPVTTQQMKAMKIIAATDEKPIYKIGEELLTTALKTRKTKRKAKA